MIFHRLRFRQTERQYQSCQRPEPTARTRTRWGALADCSWIFISTGQAAICTRNYMYKFTYINILFFLRWSNFQGSKPMKWTEVIESSRTVYRYAFIRLYRASPSLRLSVRSSCDCEAVRTRSYLISFMLFCYLCYVTKLIDWLNWSRLTRQRRAKFTQFQNWLDCQTWLSVDCWLLSLLSTV